MMTVASSGSCSYGRHTIISPLLLLLALAAVNHVPTVHAFLALPFQRSDRSFCRPLFVSTTTASAVFPEILPTEDSTTALLSRTDFWGQDRSKEEIKIHLASSFLNIALDDVEVLSASPPVVLIHNLLTHDQCHAIMDGALHQQLQRSTTYILGDDDDDDDVVENADDTTASSINDSVTTADATAKAPPLTSDIRTSSTVWLRDDQDEDDGNSSNEGIHNVQIPPPVSLLSQTLRQVADYASHMSGLPPHYMENLQVVRYLPGQEFQVHTDHLDSFNELERGGRLATCLFYLQSPTRGGATYFPEVDVEVKPRGGSALFFWNTLERPGCPEYQDNMFLHADERVRHAGLPVMEGEKWICNRWIHPVDYGAGVRGL